MTVTLTLTAAQALTVQRSTADEDQNHYAHILKGRLKTLTNHLLTSRRYRNEAGISSKLLSLFDAPDSAKTKKRRLDVSRSLYTAAFHSTHQFLLKTSHGTPTKSSVFFSLRP